MGSCLLTKETAKYFHDVMSVSYTHLDVYKRQGYEYVVSTMDRIKAAALSQSDAMLQMPIITPVSSETWNVKESMASEEDMPEWGPVEERAISMEIMTAAADLACGSDAVILMHPQSIATISKMIKELV